MHFLRCVGRRAASGASAVLRRRALGPQPRAFGALLGAVFAATLASATAGTPERDKAWDALIADAKTHGGAETKLDRSTSYVFQRDDGVFVSFTRLIDGSNRSVCLIAGDQNSTVCVDWDSGKATWGRRADAATPWKLHQADSIDALAAAAPGPLDKLSAFLQSLMPRRKARSRSGEGGSGGYWRSENGQQVWVNR